MLHTNTLDNSIANSIFQIQKKRVKTEEGEKKFVHEVENMSSTAFLIGGNILLTAAHNLMYYSTLPTNISFFPGQRPPEYNFTEDQNSEEINPNLFFVNEKDIDPESIMIPKEYMDNQHKPIYDYALINLGNQTRSEDQVKKAKSIEEIVGGHLEIKGGEDAIFWNCIGVPGAPIPIQMREERGDNITQILRDEESPRTLFRSGFGMINGTSGGPWMRNGSTSIVNGLHSACNIYADTRHTCSPVFDKKFMDFVEACKQKFNPITSSTNSNSSKI